MKWPVDMYQSFVHQTQNVTLIKEGTGSALITRHMAAMLSHTWFAVQDASALQAPMTGSRPRDPNADILFTFVLAKVLKVIRHRAQEEDIHLMHATPHGDVSDVVTWVDDIAMGQFKDLQRR